MELVKAVCSRVGVGRCLERVDHLIPRPVCGRRVDIQRLKHVQITVDRIREELDRCGELLVRAVIAQLCAVDGWKDVLVLRILLPVGCHVTEQRVGECEVTVAQEHKAVRGLSGLNQIQQRVIVAVRGECLRLHFDVRIFCHESLRHPVHQLLTVKMHVGQRDLIGRHRG